MADYLHIPGAFAYLRVVPNPVKGKKKVDEKENIDTGSAVSPHVPVEASVDKTSYEQEKITNNSKEVDLSRSNDLPKETSLEDGDIKKNDEIISQENDQSKASHSRQNEFETSEVASIPEPLSLLETKDSSGKSANVAIAVDIWKQKTHDRKRHMYDFDRFMQEGIAPDPGNLSDNTSDWSTIKVHHDLLDVAIRILEIAKARNENNLLSFNKGPALSEGGLLFQHAVKIWLKEHDMMDRIHLEWVSGMTTLGQVVESEGMCDCETSYYDESEKNEKKKLNKLKSLSEEERHKIQLTNQFLSPSFHDGKINREANPSQTNIGHHSNNHDRNQGINSGSGSGGGVQVSTSIENNIEKFSAASMNQYQGMKAGGVGVKAGKTGRRLTLMLNKRLIVRKNVVASLLDHEICTHALRFSNEWEQPWAGRRAEYGLPPSTSREVASCEEGLATVNGLLNKPQDQRLLIHPALMYVAASAGEGRTFQELFDYLGRFVASPAVRFGLCRKTKVGSGSELAALGRKQIYFEGAVAVLRALIESDAKIEKYNRESQNSASTALSDASLGTTSTIPPPTEWDPVLLHCGRIPVNQSSSSSIRYMKVLDRSNVTLPHFLRSEQGILKYKETLRQIAKLNGIKTLAEEKYEKEQELLKQSSSNDILPLSPNSPSFTPSFNNTSIPSDKIEMNGFNNSSINNNNNNVKSSAKGLKTMTPNRKKTPTSNQNSSSYASKKSSSRSLSCSPALRSTPPSSDSLPPILNSSSSRGSGNHMDEVGISDNSTANGSSIPPRQNSTNRRPISRSPSPSPLYNQCRTPTNGVTTLPNIFQPSSTSDQNNSNNNALESVSTSTEGSAVTVSTSLLMPPPKPMKPNKRTKNRSLSTGSCPSPSFGSSSSNSIPLTSSSNSSTVTATSTATSTSMKASMADEMRILKEKLAKAANDHSQVTKEANSRKESGTRAEWELLLDQCKEDIKTVDNIARKASALSLDVDQANVKDGMLSDCGSALPSFTPLFIGNDNGSKNHNRASLYINRMKSSLSGATGGDVSNKDQEEKEEEESQLDDVNSYFVTPLWEAWMMSCSMISRKKAKVLFIQSWYRSLPSLRMFKKYKKAVIISQSLIRGGLSRKGKCLPFYEPSTEDKAFLKAVSLGQQTTAELWIKKGANIKARNEHGHPAVVLASRNGQLATLTWLHESLGLSLFSKSDDGRSSAHMAAWSGHLSILTYIKETTDEEINQKEKDLSCLKFTRPPPLSLKQHDIDANKIDIDELNELDTIHHNEKDHSFSPSSESMSQRSSRSHNKTGRNEKRTRHSNQLQNETSHHGSSESPAGSVKKLIVDKSSSPSSSSPLSAVSISSNSPLSAPSPAAAGGTSPLSLGLSKPSTLVEEMNSETAAITAVSSVSQTVEENSSLSPDMSAQSLSHRKVAIGNNGAASPSSLVTLGAKNDEESYISKPKNLSKSRTLKEEVEITRNFLLNQYMLSRDTSDDAQTSSFRSVLSVSSINWEEVSQIAEQRGEERIVKWLKYYANKKL